MISQPCSSETINIKQLTFQAENKLVNIPLSHFPPLPKCNFSFSPLKPSSGEAFSSCIGFSIGFLNFGSSHLVLVILQDLFKRLLRFCYKNSLGGILSSFKEQSLSSLETNLILLQKESSSSCSRDQNQFMTGTLHISEAVLLPPLQTCPQHEDDWRPTLGSDRGQEQEGEGPRRGRRGWWRPRRWCPPRRGSCPPGGWRGWCRGSST